MSIIEEAKPDEILPIFRFGVISDPQYVDTEDGTNYDKTIIRRYRHSFEILQAACAEFSKEETTCNIVLGDTIDGKAGSLNIHEECLTQILSHTALLSPGKWHFVIGNHDLYCFSRDKLKHRLYNHVQFSSRGDSKALYYDFVPFPGYRFIMLDAFDVSEFSSSKPEYRNQAITLLNSKNPNYASGSSGWLDGLSDEDSRYTPANGGISADQLAWLTGVLQEAEIQHEKCIIFSHIATYGPCTQPSTLLWNSEEVLSVLQSSSSVVAVLAGHDHDGGYAQDEAGIHHLAPPAPLECEVGEHAYGYVEVFADHLELQWTGRVPQRTPWPTSMYYRPTP